MGLFRSEAASALFSVALLLPPLCVPACMGCPAPSFPRYCPDTVRCSFLGTPRVRVFHLLRKTHHGVKPVSNTDGALRGPERPQNGRGQRGRPEGRGRVAARLRACEAPDEGGADVAICCQKSGRRSRSGDGLHSRGQHVHEAGGFSPARCTGFPALGREKGGGGDAAGGSDGPGETEANRKGEPPANAVRSARLGLARSSSKGGALRGLLERLRGTEPGVPVDTGLSICALCYYSRALLHIEGLDIPRPTRRL